MWISIHGQMDTRMRKMVLVVLYVILGSLTVGCDADAVRPNQVDYFGISLSSIVGGHGEASSLVLIGDVSYGNPGWLRPPRGLYEPEPDPPGYVWALDVRDGRVLLEMRGESPGERFGVGAAIITGADGQPKAYCVVADRVVAGGSQVRAFCAQRGTLMWTVDLSCRRVVMEVLGDHDGDGVADLVIGQPYAGHDEEGVLTVLSGRDGAILYERRGLRPGQRLGWRVAVLGTSEAHGLPTVAVVDRPRDLADAGNRIGAGAEDAPLGGLYAFSGSDFSLQWSFSQTRPGAHFGRAVAVAGDVNGDGVPDVIVTEGHGSSGVEAVIMNEVWVLSGADGAIIHRLQGPLGYFGDSVLGLGDIDGDGHDDFVIGSPDLALGPGVLDVYSGASGKKIYRIFEDYSGVTGRTEKLGVRMALVGDIDMDGVPDFLASAMCPHSCSSRGHVFLYSGASGRVLRVWTQADLARQR